MRRTILLTSGCLLLLLSFAGVPASAHDKAKRGVGGTPLLHSRQLILVTTSDWEAVRGTLRRFERKGARGVWRRVGASVPVVVGRGGLGWGQGLNAQTGEGPSKKEGDGKAPAGVFSLGRAFGFATHAEAAWLRMPYMNLSPETECVDDVNSRWYNTVMGRDGIVVDWNSSEHMRSVEGYRWGLVVNHNAPRPVPGRGSCIFLHIWAGPEKGTAGCTALEQMNLEELLRWLDPKKRPLFVQLPEGEFARLRQTWRLPRLDGE